MRTCVLVMVCTVVVSGAGCALGVGDERPGEGASGGGPVEVGAVAQAVVCEPFTATNDEHVAAGRARKESTGFLFFTVDSYFATGSDNALGSDGTTVTTVYENAGGGYGTSAILCLFGGADTGTGGAATGGAALPPIADYGARGPFAVTIERNTGPDGQYTMFRPTQLGDGGFLHPIATWGNGIITTPELYIELLSTVASHGFVVIASNSSVVNALLMTAGLDWLIQQNRQPGMFQGRLAVDRAVSIGYSLGGGAAVDAGSHPNVVATVSFHGLQGGAEWLRTPLLLTTSTGDNFVSAAGFVTPTYNRSATQTFYATLTGYDHLRPLFDAGEERAPAIAWLRLWVYGDQGARRYFYGNDCVLCRAPWVNPQRKNWR